MITIGNCHGDYRKMPMNLSFYRDFNLVYKGTKMEICRISRLIKDPNTKQTHSTRLKYLKAENSIMNIIKMVKRQIYPPENGNTI